MEIFKVRRTISNVFSFHHQRTTSFPGLERDCFRVDRLNAKFQTPYFLRYRTLMEMQTKTLHLDRTMTLWSKPPTTPIQGHSQQNTLGIVTAMILALHKSLKTPTMRPLDFDRQSHNPESVEFISRLLVCTKQTTPFDRDPYFERKWCCALSGASYVIAIRLCRFQKESWGFINVDNMPVFCVLCKDSKRRKVSYHVCERSLSHPALRRIH